MHAQFERGLAARKRGKRPLQVVQECRAVQAGERCERIAGRDRIGGIRLHQHRGPLAAQELALEVFREC